jgi:hypothetical protein
MGMIAETADVRYRLSFADQGKQTFTFYFQFVENKRKMPFLLVLFSVYIQYIETAAII